LAFHSGREADHSPPSSAEVKEWVKLYLHSPNTPSWRGAQLGGAQGQLSATGWTTGVQFPAVTMMEIFSSPPLPDWVLRRIQLPIHSVAGVSFPRVKAAGT
jgi:hypothetical protein